MPGPQGIVVSETVYGITMVRDEVGIIRGVLAHMAGQVDRIIVADNLSSDGTSEVLAQLAQELPITVVADPEPGYYQAHKMTRLAEMAAFEGATWIAPFDADELWYGIDGRRVAEVLVEQAWPIAAVPIINHFRTALDVADDDPFRAMVWHQAAPQPLGKVAFRWEPEAHIHQGNHGVTLPSVPADLVSFAMMREPVVQLRHFPIRSAEQMITKARNGGRAYAAAPGLPEDAGQHWRAWYELLERHGEQALRAAFAEHYYYSSPVDQGLVRDPAPYRPQVPAVRPQETT